MTSSNILSQLGLAQILDFLPDASQIKLVMFFACVILFALLVFIIIRINKLNRRPMKTIKNIVAPLVPARGGVGMKWEEIMRHIDSPREAEWKFAVIESDKLVDEVLKSAGYPGETMGERLVNIDKAQLVSLEGLWEAHKLRNKIAHDANSFVRYAQAKRAIELYEKALQELGVL